MPEQNARQMFQQQVPARKPVQSVDFVVIKTVPLIHFHQGLVLQKWDAGMNTRELARIFGIYRDQADLIVWLNRTCNRDARQGWIERQVA